MNRHQAQIRKFCEDRNWGQFHNPKDLLLGIVEEVGEFRNLIKWEQDPEVIRKVLLSKKEIVKDSVGDLFWFLSLLANGCGVDIDESIEMVIKENEGRFPLEKTNGKHTNIHLGGHDGKYSGH
jgi:dCTP diphosphatase